ncbi:MAG: CPBP family intramembrane metalloprotease [Deltaproteobacteria bacterium]|nr:CPBP family intramembrane metalloprotease [Deltaproteobacteria bacterium]
MDPHRPEGLPEGERGPALQELGPGDRTEHVAPGARRRVFLELTALWLATLLAIRMVVMVQGLGLPDVVLAAVPFLFIYAPVWLCNYRGVDSYGYRLAIPAFRDLAEWRAAARLCGGAILVVLVPWLVGYHLYQNLVAAFLHAAGPLRDVDDVLRALARLVHGELGILGDDPVATLTRTVVPRWRVPREAWLLVPYHLFFVAIPEEIFYRGYFQTRLNEVFPRKFLIFGVPLGWGLLIACAYFAFGHSLVTVRWWHFATFFPGLLFGWMREKSGGPLAGALFHAWANVTVTVLDTFYGIRPTA